MPMHRKGRGLWAICLLFLGIASPTEATVVRAMALNELVAASDEIVVATAIKARSHYEYVGGARRVVTDTELRVDQVLLAKPKPVVEGATLTVRSSGGVIGELVYQVYGEARLTKGGTHVLFLGQGADGRYHVTGRAQGEYGVANDDKGGWVLRPSRGLDAVLNGKRSAVRVLAGRSLAEAADLILQVAAQFRQFEGVS